MSSNMNLSAEHGNILKKHNLVLTRNILKWQRLQTFSRISLNVHFMLHFGLSVLTSHPTKYPNNQVSERPPSLSGSSFICNKHVLSCHTTNIPQYDVYVRVYCTNRHIYLPFTCYGDITCRGM